MAETIKRRPSYRLHYSRSLEISLIVALLLISLIFMSSKEFELAPQTTAVENFILKVEDIPITKQVVTHPPPPRPNIPLESDDPAIEGDQTIPNVRWDSSMVFVPPLAQGPVIFELVEQKPEMIGGRKAIYDFIMKNRLYPKTALTAGVGGWCLIGWIVDKHGLPRNIEVLEESPQGLGFGEAGVKAISAMRFKPGMQRDRAVEVSMSQRIVFALK